MKRNSIGVLLLVFGAAVSASAQSLDDLNIQFHGYATQGFLYTSQNNILTANSSDGSPAWTEAVVNLSTTPLPKLRIAVQARYSLIGETGNDITVDFASADYKVNERFGFRFGKVKTPSNLFNEIQDIDPAYLWSLLPQSVYPILSRNSALSSMGGLVYGSTRLGNRLGKLDYAAWSGITPLTPNDGYFIADKDAGITLPNGLTVPNTGLSLHWRTPLRGLTVGASDIRDGTSTASVVFGPATGSLTIHPFNDYDGFLQYERSRVMLAAEYSRFPVSVLTVFGPAAIPGNVDLRRWYGMATCKLTEKLSAGIYQSQQFDRAHALGPTRFSKDWTLSARYDFNQYLYAKAEQHFIDGTAIVYDTQNNAGGLQPDTRLTIFKAGVSF